MDKQNLLRPVTQTSIDYCCQTTELIEQHTSPTVCLQFNLGCKLDVIRLRHANPKLQYCIKNLVSLFNQSHFQLSMPQHLNAAKNGNHGITDDERSKLEWLMPYDMWLYNYATLLFDARKAHLTTGEPYQAPPRPPLPRVTCLRRVLRFYA